MEKRVRMRPCQWRLVIVWGLFSFACVVLLIVQSSVGKYGEASTDAFAWFLPTVLPTLSLMIAALVDNERRGDETERDVSQFLYRLAFGLSVIYLSLVGFAILFEPFAIKQGVAYLTSSNIWLGPFQGLVAGTLGVFFVRTSDSARRDAHQSE